MVSIIKNQLLKHLSKFTKNLSADKINLSAFKGEGELSNLELNEVVLTDLLELPSWLRLTKAWCNKVLFRIQWTKLKSVPIQLNLDEVNIIVETCEELRLLSGQGSFSSYATVPGKYSFIHKVIDGITVIVNVVNITFNSPAFEATVQVSRIVVQSKNRKWEECDLRMTRLKDPEKGQLLIFKELSWQTVRIEAKSTKDKSLIPLRLLTNQAKCRIVIKKRLADSAIVGSRLVIILDDLLWVLTDSQLKAALHFLDSLSGLVRKATLITRKVKAAKKLEELPEYHAQQAQQERQKDKISKISQIFAKHDVVETSYHFVSQQIVLHLCDDVGGGRSSHPDLKDGGALQISLKRFQVDYYPYHLASGDKKHWPCYRENVTPHTQWQEQALNAFKSKFLDLIERNKIQHVPLSRANVKRTSGSYPSDLPSPQGAEHRHSSYSQNNVLKNMVATQFAKLMTTYVVLRMEDFTLYKVTTSGKKQSLKEFIAGDRDHMSLPEEASIVHAEFIYYYYPNDTPFPLPPPKFYVHLNPIQIMSDVDSCLWFNSFALNLHQSLLDSKQDISASDFTYIDVKIEAILPKIVFESNIEFHNQKDRPKSLNFQVTRVTITNVRSLEQSSRADLAKCVDSFHMGSLFFGSEFPSEASDFYIVTQKFLDHISTKDDIRKFPADLTISTIDDLLEILSREMLWTEAKDVWCICLEPVWGEFLGARAVGVNKAVPFLDAIPVTIWLHTHMDPNSTIKVKKSEKNSPRTADIHALAHVSNLVSIQLNHYQYLFLLRLADELAELATFLSIDSSRILKVESSGSLAVGALIPQLEVTFVMPSQCPGKESSGGDVESFVPDSSSIPEDGFPLGSTSFMFRTSTMSMMQADNVNRMTLNETEGTNSTLNCVNLQPQADIYPKITSQPFSTTTISNNLNAGFSSMKKGFTNLVTSFDTTRKASPDDISDTISIRSDVSSDSERYVFLPTPDDRNVESVDDMFYVSEFCYESKAAVEIASEVVEEDSTVTSASDHSFTSSCRRKDLVSISTFKLNKVEFLHQSVGYSSSVKVQVGNVSTEDCSSIPWDEFQSKFSSRARAWTDIPSNDSTTTRVKMRLDHKLTLPSSKSMVDLDFSDKDRLKKLFKDLLIVHVSNLSLDLTMSTVIGLGDLSENEVIVPPLPMEVTLENVQLNLIEDRPPVNITSPGPVPINLDVTTMFIVRGEDGVFRIIPAKPAALSNSSSTISEQDILNQSYKQLKSENDELRRRLVAFERVSAENRELRRSKEEIDILRSCLSSAQDEVSRLLDEKKELLEEIKKLQGQLPMEKWNGSR